MTLALSDTLAELRRQLSGQLPARVDAINTLARSLELAVWDVSDAEVLHRLVQHLTNSAGIFGMQSVSDAAHSLEARLAALLKAGTAPTQADWQAIRTGLDHLEQQTRMQSTRQSIADAPGADALTARH